jgi:hypothetical protein
VSAISSSTKHKAQVYDLALNAFFRARDLDAESLGTPKADVGWDIAEAMVAAAVSGVTYKTRSQATLIDAAMLLRGLADKVEQDGLASLEWGYKGDMLSRHAWRPDIRTSEGLEELDKRTASLIDGLMGTTRSLTVADKRAIVCLSFVRMALDQVCDLIDQEPENAEPIRSLAVAIVENRLEELKTTSSAQ